MAAQCISAVCRYVLAGAALLVPASVITATSCADLNCSAKCDPSGGGTTISCAELAVSECSTYSFCAAQIGCACPLSSADALPQNCNSAACHAAMDTAECALTIGCEWGSHCRDTTDCHTMDLDETACRKNPRCSYHKDCG